MGPARTSFALRRIAAAIDASKSPVVSAVLRDLRSVVARVAQEGASGDLEECAKMCEDCAAMCDSHADKSAIVRACAEVCRACAEECRRMASEAGGEAPAEPPTEPPTE